MRVAPETVLFMAVGRGGLGHERRQHPRGRWPAEQPHCLERLVGEVERVALVEEDVVGGRRRHHVVDIGLGDSRNDGGRQRSLRRVGRSGVDEPAVPAGQTVAGWRLALAVSTERGQRESRRSIAGVARYERQAVHQRQSMVVDRQVGQQVGHGDEHRQPGAPPLRAVGGAVVDARANDVGRGHSRLEQAEHRFRGDQRQALFEPFGQTVVQMGDAIGLGLDDEEHVVALDLHGVGAHVIGERVEGVARCEIESGVVPVAREQPVLDGTPVEREAHVGATVVDRVRATLVPEDADAVSASLGQQLPIGLQLRQ